MNLIIKHLLRSLPWTCKLNHVLTQIANMLELLPTSPISP
uniref:Uncharacterized protein n=1 Tax=Arundo donax TaxID=35708 RepID=A0A0A8YUW8_ARUDO